MALHSSAAFVCAVKCNMEVNVQKVNILCGQIVQSIRTGLYPHQNGTSACLLASAAYVLLEESSRV